MIKTLEELKQNISHLSQDEQDKFLKFAKPFYDFYEYMYKLGKTYEEIEEESAHLSKELLPSFLKELKSLKTTKESSLEFITKFSGRVMKKYAESYNYENAEEVETSMNKYMELSLKYNLIKNDKQ